MASTTAMITLLSVLAVVLPTLGRAAEFVVGDNEGWSLGVNYTAWAQDKVFRVGDTLVFKYPLGYDNVFKVSGPDFQECIVPPPNEALTSGNDVIVLASPGRRWYISGVGYSANCRAGEKLVITVYPAEWQPPSPQPTAPWTPGTPAQPAAPWTAVIPAQPTASWTPVPAPSPVSSGWGSSSSSAPEPAAKVGSETPNVSYFFNRFLKH